MNVKWTDIIILFGAAAICVVAYIKWVFNYWQRKNIPYLKPSFPMGNFEAPWAIKKGYHANLGDIYLEFKSKGHKFVGIFSCLRPVLIITDLDLLKRIMIKDFQYFVDRGVYYNEKTDPLSAHLFNIDGEKWRHLRTRLSPTYTSGKLKAIFQLIIDCGNGLENEISKLYVNKEPVDVKEMGALFITNVIGTCAFGLDCNCFENPNNEFRIHTKKFFSGSITKFIRKLITLSFPNLCKKLGVRIITKDTAQFFMEVTRNVMNARESKKVERKDFFQLLLDIKNNAKRAEESFTFEEIAAQAFAFFLAGFETSSSTMTFAFYEMARHQEIQDKVREEIRNVIGKYGGKLTYDGIKEMRYMGQVFDETLRKYPIGATLDRVCTKDYKVPGEDLVLTKGTKILIPLIGLHHDPEYYPNPEKFDPQRFSPENTINRHVCAYMPFGEGPRICIAKRFGILQAKIGMVIMLKDYKYTLNPKCPEVKLNIKSASVLSPIGQVLLDIEKVH